MQIGDSEIVTTPGHPFFIYGKGFEYAGNLRAGDILVNVNGEKVVLEFIQHEILESPVKVYNFEVEDWHTYFVGENKVWVHNDCASAAKTAVDKCRNPYGRGGGPAHKEVVEGLKQQIRSRGNTFETEVAFKVENGFKSVRYADIVEKQGATVKAIYQVGKVSKNGMPVVRESRAIADIIASEASGSVPVNFVPYNSSIGSIIYLH